MGGRTMDIVVIDQENNSLPLGRRPGLSDMEQVSA
jgi:hypothetical protein